MKPDLAFAYAQARIQARFAALPAEQDWQRLAASRTLASFLEEARTGTLRDWVEGFSGKSDAHDLEAGLRSFFWGILEAVAGWVPAPWRPAVLWTRWLPLLPLLAHLRSGGAMPGWVGRDPALQALVGSAGALDAGRLQAGGARCLLRTDTALTALWRQEWRRRWPSCSAAAVSDLDTLTGLLAAHLDAFGRVAPEAAWPLRRGLREDLRRRFRHCALRPSLPFLFLALTALDLERLRAALVSRVLFCAQDEPAWLETAARFAV